MKNNLIRLTALLLIAPLMVVTTGCVATKTAAHDTVSWIRGALAAEPRDDLVVKFRNAREQEAAVSPRGAAGYRSRVDADDLAAVCEQFADAREARAAEADDARVRGELALQGRQPCPRFVVPHGIVPFRRMMARISLHAWPGPAHI